MPRAVVQYHSRSSSQRAYHSACSCQLRSPTPLPTWRPSHASTASSQRLKTLFDPAERGRRLVGEGPSSAL